MIHAPCKAYYYPEFFPDQFIGKKRTVTNYAEVLHLADSLGIHQLDFNTWYNSLKNKSRELLYPKQAFHWSVYGSLLAADTLIKYLEAWRAERLVHPHWDRIVHTSKPRYTDDDIAKDCDLIFPTAIENFSYPEVTYPADKATTKPQALFIGDSFMLTWIYDGIMDNVFTRWQAMYYYKYLYDHDHGEQQEAQYIDTNKVKDALAKADCIVLVYTAHNLCNLGNGFIEQAYRFYYPGK